VYCLSDNFSQLNIFLWNCLAKWIDTLYWFTTGQSSVADAKATQTRLRCP